MNLWTKKNRRSKRELGNNFIKAKWEDIEKECSRIPDRTSPDERYNIAYKRVKRIKGFYVHVWFMSW